MNNIGSTTDPSLHGSILSDFFVRLNEAKISYCVLRGYAGLPDEVSHDVDILVEKIQIDLLEEILKDVSRSKGWQLIKRENRFGYRKWMLVFNFENSFSSLHLDVWTIISWKSFQYIDSKIVLCSRKVYNGFWVASSGCEAAISLLKEYLQIGKVKDKGDGRTKVRISKLAHADQDNFKLALRPFLGIEISRIMLEGALNEDWSNLEKKIGKVRICLIYRAFIRNFLKQFWRWAYFIWLHFVDRIITPSGLFLCFIGPDGSGKTTVSKKIQRDLNKTLGLTKYYHAHWRIFPELKAYFQVVMRIFNRIAKRELVHSTNQIQNLDNHSINSPQGFVNVIYYSLEYLFGYIILLQARMRNEIIVFDRYFYDYLIQSTYSRVPRWLLLILERVLPSPNILIWLRNIPDVIHQRKQELTTSQILRQMRVCEEIIGRNSKIDAYTVWTDGGVESTVNLVRIKVFEFLSNRISNQRKIW